MTRISGWGRYPVVETELTVPQTSEAARAATALADGLIARGAGRAYGDAAIGATRTLQTLRLDRMRAFDPETGLVTLEAGVVLADLIAAFAPRGFFPAVVPGTRFVTVGGAIAADVHGKNHHRDGGFGDHVDSLLIATADGQVLRASNDSHPDLFAATIGGMGLTGTILEATLRLRRIETGWIRQEVVVAPDLDAAIAALDAGDAATYSVAWIDCLATGASLGRSVVFLGEHADADALDGTSAADRVPALTAPRLSMPADLPRALLRREGIGLFNALYFRAGQRQAGCPRLVPAGRYFFPLDGIANWNRIYGKAGFAQYQFVVPLPAKPVLAEILGRIAQRGDASFLTVLKKLGKSRGILSFPMPGYTLALDFPMTASLLPFLDNLDRLVAGAGGRIYLAKDARQSRATFEATTPGLARFGDIRASVDPHGLIRSQLSTRLGL